jgi:hypothetical protein
MHARKHIPLIALAFVFTALSSTAAQGVAVFGAAEGAGDNTTLFLIGANVTANGLGWRPYAGVTAYGLHYNAGGGSTNQNVFEPNVGLSHQMTDQSLSFGVGYAFSNKNDNFVAFVPGQTGQGVVGEVGWEYWGNGTRAAQLLGSYNFGNNFLWSRGRASVPVRPASPVWIGGELALLGDTQSPSVWVAQLGPTLEYRFTPQFRLGGSAGLKFGLSNANGSNAYGRIEFLWLPTQK